MIKRNKIPINTQVVVSNTAPFHAGKTGYVDFYGVGFSSEVVVLRQEESPKACPKTLFAVNIDDCKKVPDVYNVGSIKLSYRMR